MSNMLVVSNGLLPVDSVQFDIKEDSALTRSAVLKRNTSQNVNNPFSKR
jgi:hypothetical protein